MMTDDQGIGDFGIMGNKFIETPNIDALAKNSGSLTTFYVSPVCSPTRASLMTGRYNQRTRCIDTWVGRSMMDPDEHTVAESLQSSGYKTGIFGKWHLGDCYPMRPQDQGFQEVLIHRGGGLAQPADPLENNDRYTNPILFNESGAAVQTKGYCTDVYFDAAMEFITRQSASDSPFFVYLATNAPHGPYHDVPENLRAHYMTKNLVFGLHQDKIPKNPQWIADMQDRLARIAAMITNEDQNVGRLVEYLKANGLLENTLIIRMNDNGPNTSRFVGEMVGNKTHVFEGGLRSPCWLHWPAKIPAGMQVNELSAHIDIMPTILEACGAEQGEHALDGHSLLGLFLDPENTDLPERPIVIQSHRGPEVVRYHHCMLRRGDWKIVHPSGFGKLTFEGEPEFRLHNLAEDPMEMVDLAAENPEMLAVLRAEYDAWFDDVSTSRPNNFAPPRIIIGTEHEPETHLTRQDWLGESWGAGSTGHWIVQVPEPITADIEVIFPPDRCSAQGAVQMTIGDQLVKASTLSHSRIFESVPIPAGEIRLEATRKESEIETSAYQIILRTDR